MSALDEALAVALAVPLKQLPSVLAALIDLSRGEIRIKETPEPLREAASMRFAGQRQHIDLVIGARVRPELYIASLIVAAPVLEVGDWQKLDPIVLAGTLPRAPREIAREVAREVIGRKFAQPIELAEVLASASPFVEGETLQFARQRSLELTDPELRKAAVIALDTGDAPEAFRAALGADAQWFPQLEWWTTTATTKLIADVADALAKDPAGATKLAAAVSHATDTLGRLAGGWAHAKPPRIDDLVRIDDTLRGDKPVPHEEPPRVSVGFAHTDEPERPLGDTSLVAGATCWLWLEIAPRDLPGAIGGGLRVLPRLPNAAQIDVVLFPYPGQLEIDEPYRRGVVRVVAGRSEVLEPAGKPIGLEPAARLYFPIRTPESPGRYAVRVGLYHRGCLLQSHVVSAITGDGSPHADAFSLVTDYSLTRQFDLSALGPAKLSILLNDDPGGTHSFRFFRDETKLAADATIDGAELETLIEFARGALRLAAWGTRVPWRNAQLDPYRYATPDLANLKNDLITLSIHGARLFTQALVRFRKGTTTVAAFRHAMRVPGVIQLALRQSTTLVFPVSLVYDYPLDPNSSKLVLCDQFIANIQAGAPLSGTPCFEGQCPHYDDQLVVCPGGFWGFRHQIGMPPSLDTAEATRTVGGTAATAIAASISTDASFIGRDEHLRALGKLNAKTSVIDDRLACLRELGRGNSHVEYFYCHGGTTAAGTSFLEVGAPGSDGITADNLIDISWTDPRPLIVLNGCHTADMSPEQVFALATGFLAFARASGVIGTEITIFEPLARAFGEEFLRQFIDGGQPLGIAMRNTRLAMLAKLVPLGLVYMPLALPNLKLRD